MAEHRLSLPAAIVGILAALGWSQGRAQWARHRPYLQLSSESGPGESGLPLYMSESQCRACPGSLFLQSCGPLAGELAPKSCLPKLCVKQFPAEEPFSQDLPGSLGLKEGCVGRKGLVEGGARWGHPD